MIKEGLFVPPKSTYCHKSHNIIIKRSKIKVNYFQSEFRRIVFRIGLYIPYLSINFFVFFFLFNGII